MLHQFLHEDFMLTLGAFSLPLVWVEVCEEARMFKGSLKPDIHIKAHSRRSWQVPAAPRRPLPQC